MIYKTSFNTEGIAVVRGAVKTCYDTNGNGDLVPVRFSQERESSVELRYTPRGDTYVQYKD